MGIVGDLSAGEIVEQLLHSRRLERADRHSVAAGATEEKVEADATVATAAGASMGPTASTADASIEAATEAATTSLTTATAAAIAASPAVLASVRRGGGGGGSASGVRNVVFMGMGEPLNNYRAVCAAVRVLIDPSLFGIRSSCVIVSTVGIVPRSTARTSTAIHVQADCWRALPSICASRLARTLAACALHAPIQPRRKAIMPPPRAPTRSLAYNGSSGSTYVPTRPARAKEQGGAGRVHFAVADKPEDAAALAALLSPHSDRLMYA